MSAPKPSHASKAAIPIRAVDFMMYHASKPAKTRAWYQKLFGLGRGEEWHAFWSEFATQPVTFCLNGPDPSRDPQWEWSRSPAIAFAVEDIRAAVRQSRRHRVKVLKGPVETSVCWMLFIQDPEGNRLILHQRKDGSCG